MYIIVGFFSLGLSVLCAIGGFLLGHYSKDLTSSQRFLAYVFWIFPVVIALSSFRESQVAARRKARMSTPPPSDSADPLLDKGEQKKMSA